MTFTRNRLAWYPGRLTLSLKGRVVETGSKLLEEERIELTKELQWKLTNYFYGRFTTKTKIKIKTKT